MTVDIETLRLETLSALHALAREHGLPAPESVTMYEFTTEPEFTSLILQLADGHHSKPGVEGWAKVLGLPEPTLDRIGKDESWHESYRSQVNQSQPVWLAWTMLEVKCTVRSSRAS